MTSRSGRVSRKPFFGRLGFFGELAMLGLVCLENAGRLDQPWAANPVLLMRARIFSCDNGELSVLLVEAPVSHFSHDLRENALVCHPSGGFSFGAIPEMPQYSLPGGDIFLRAGVHLGPNRGFGVRHIWEAHQKDLAKHGCTSIESIAVHIASIVVPNAPIYCEFREIKKEQRVAVLKLKMGSLILEARHERRGFGYYVVTWYPQSRPSGTLVGRVVARQI